MATLEFPEEREAPEADAAEQALPVDDDETEAALVDPPLPGELPWDADPADAIEQAVPVPVDDDEYR